MSKTPDSTSIPQSEQEVIPECCPECGKPYPYLDPQKTTRLLNCKCGHNILEPGALGNSAGEPKIIQLKLFEMETNHYVDLHQ